MNQDQSGDPRKRRPWLAASVVAVTVLANGCSIKKLAVNQLGNALAGSGASWASDDDPELVRDATPFALKTIESLLGQSPNHKGLLLAATSGFTQYGYAFVANEADFVEAQNLTEATRLRARAKRLFVRARDYGLRGLDVYQPGLVGKLKQDANAALLTVHGKGVVPLLYWTAAAWGSAISLAKEDSQLSADLPIVEALMRRALFLDEGFGEGSIHDFFIAYEGGRPASAGGSVERARQHFEKALTLAKGRRAAPFVSFAETVCVGSQNRAEFEKLLKNALEIDADRTGDQRLANLIALKRARWLLARVDELFIE